MQMYLDGVEVALTQIAELTRRVGPVPVTADAGAGWPTGPPTPCCSPSTT